MINDLYNAIIISIKSIHAEKIYSGEKRYELRKVAPKTFPEVVFIYETEGKKAITGVFYVKDIISLPIADLWKRVGIRATSKKSFNKYYSGYKTGVAYEIGSVYKFEEPVPLAHIIDLQTGFTIPQSFAYLSKHPILERQLYDMLEVFRQNSDSRLSFSLPTEHDLVLFKELAQKEISKNYDEIDNSFAQAIIKSAKLGYDPNGFFTKGKQIVAVKCKGELVGFTVLSYKISDAIKTGPTLILESFRRKGFGTEIRKWIEQFALAKGYRKLYCTCNATDDSILQYLLKSGMRIEAHLLNQYKKESSELILGKLLMGGSVKKYPLFFRSDIKQAKLVEYDNTHYDAVKTLLLSDFKKSFLPVSEDFVKRLCQSTQNFKIDKYSSKGKVIFLGQDSDSNLLSIIICSPKRGGAVKLWYLSKTSNYAAFLYSLSNIALYFKKQKRTKLYITIPCSDYQTLRYFEQFGFAKEGILAEPYQPEVDMIQLGFSLQIITDRPRFENRTEAETHEDGTSIKMPQLFEAYPSE